MPDKEETSIFKEPITLTGSNPGTNNLLNSIYAGPKQSPKTEDPSVTKPPVTQVIGAFNKNNTNIGPTSGLQTPKTTPQPKLSNSIEPKTTPQPKPSYNIEPKTTPQPKLSNSIEPKTTPQPKPSYNPEPITVKPKQASNKSSDTPTAININKGPNPFLVTERPTRSDKDTSSHVNIKGPQPSIQSNSTAPQASAKPAEQAVVKAPEKMQISGTLNIVGLPEGPATGSLVGIIKSNSEGMLM